MIFDELEPSEVGGRLAAAVIASNQKRQISRAVSGLKIKHVLIKNLIANNCWRTYSKHFSLWKYKKILETQEVLGNLVDFSKHGPIAVARCASPVKIAKISDRPLWNRICVRKTQNSSMATPTAKERGRRALQFYTPLFKYFHV